MNRITLAALAAMTYLRAKFIAGRNKSLRQEGAPIQRFRYAFLLAACVPLLASCRADITYRYDLHSNNAVMVTTKEVFDNEFYQLILNQDHSGDPFGDSSAKKQGWAVSRTVDDVGNHIFTMVKTMPLSEISDAGATPKTAGGSLPFNLSALKKTEGLFTDTETIKTTIPRLMPKSSTDSSNAYANAGNAMAASIVGLHLELRTPGKVIATNGETTADGFTRWDLALQHPTNIEYSIETTDTMHIAMAVGLGILVIVIAVAAIARRRPTKAPLQL